MAALHPDAVTPTQLDEHTWRIVASRSMRLFSWGELIRVIVHEDTMGTEVRVLTRRRLATNVTAKGDWSDALFDRMDREQAGASGNAGIGARPDTTVGQK